MSARDIRVWQIGPHRDAQGGISTVIRQLVAAQRDCPGVRVSALATAVSGGRAAKAVMLGAAWLRLLAACLARQVDVLHVHSSSGASARRKAVLTGLAERCGVPWVLHVHGSNYDQWYEEASPEDQAWIRRQLDGAAAVIALSESWRAFLSPLTSTPVHVVYNSVSPEAFAWPRPARRPGPLRLLFLGLLGERKGSYDLLEAVARVSVGPDPVAVELKLAGDGDVAGTQEAIGRLGLERKVEYLGWIGPERKVELLADADVFVLPSYREGLPMAILEAMAAGVAVLTTPVNGIPEAITDGANGLFVAPGDVPALATAIRRLAADPELVRRLGAAGRADVERRFDIRRAAAQLVGIYRECLAR